MGSRATDLKCRIGGVEGRALRAGDTLPIGASPREGERCWKRLAARMTKTNFAGAGEAWLRGPIHPWRVCGAARVPLLRAVLGPQDEAFTPAGLDAFLRGTYTLTPACDRMACKLAGPKIETCRGSDILSDGIAEGSVQVSADGQPIVMLADHQTTGGYAKIATVIAPDVAVLAQLRPGEAAAFCGVSPGEAVAAARREAAKLKWLEEQIL